MLRGASGGQPRGRSATSRRFRKTDVAFHYGIATIAKNTMFTSLLEAVVEWLTEQRLTSGRAAGAGETA